MTACMANALPSLSAAVCEVGRGGARLGFGGFSGKQRVAGMAVTGVPARRLAVYMHVVALGCMLKQQSLFSRIPCSSGSGFGCRVPDVPHEVVHQATAAAAGDSGASSQQRSPPAAAALRRCRASVVVFSPCGTLLGAAVEEEPHRWALQVCPSYHPARRVHRRTRKKHRECLLGPQLQPDDHCIPVTAPVDRQKHVLHDRGFAATYECRDEHPTPEPGEQSWRQAGQHACMRSTQCLRRIAAKGRILYVAATCMLGCGMHALGYHTAAPQLHGLPARSADRRRVCAGV